MRAIAECEGVELAAMHLFLSVLCNGIGFEGFLLNRALSFWTIGVVVFLKACYLCQFANLI